MNRGKYTTLIFAL